MTNRVTLNFAEDFTDAPGGRDRESGPSSAEEFREEVLLPAYTRADELSCELLVDLDGIHGMASSFAEEAFGGLVRVEGCDKGRVQALLTLKSDEDPCLIEEINGFIADVE